MSVSGTTVSWTPTSGVSSYVFVRKVPNQTPVYWIVNLVERQVEVYTSPGQLGYGTRTDHAADGEVMLELGGVELGTVRVAELLP